MDGTNDDPRNLWLHASAEQSAPVIGSALTMRRLKVLLNPERWMRRTPPGTELVTWTSVIAQTGTRWASRRNWRARGKTLAGLHLPQTDKRPGTIWAVTMVKNEVDIIEHTVRHLLQQGIDHILIADNGSTDGTFELLRGLSKSLPIYVGTDSEVGYYQANKITELAKYARKHGASWIVPFDADEFWFAPGCTVSEYLRSSSSAQIRAHICNIFPTRDNPELYGLEGQLSVDTDISHPCKVAPRARPLLWIDYGNHWALTPGIRRNGLHILHLPWRSYQQFERKLRDGARAILAADIEDYVGAHWRAQADGTDDAIRSLWESLLDGHAPSSLGWYPKGPFVECAPGAWKSWDPDHVIRKTAR